MVGFSIIHYGATAPDNQGHAALGADRHNISLSVRLRFVIY